MGLPEGLSGWKVRLDGSRVSPEPGLHTWPPGWQAPAPSRAAPRISDTPQPRPSSPPPRPAPTPAEASKDTAGRGSWDAHLGDHGHGGHCGPLGQRRESTPCSQGSLSGQPQAPASARTPPAPLTLSEAHVSAGCPWWLRASPQLTLLELPSHGAHTFRSLASWPSVGPGVRESF